MNLKFLGRGAGFNPVEGSTSAYFIDNNEMFLIDCGESIFKTVMEKKLLDSVSALNVLITHTHMDHIGSLGTLILYGSVVKKLPVKIITDKNMGFLSKLNVFLIEIAGLTEKMYSLADVSEYEGKYSSFSKVSYFKTKHCDEVESCGILFETDCGMLIYSGDLYDPAPIMEIINDCDKSTKKIDKMYIDSNNDIKPNLHHISIHILKDMLSPELKSKVYCMHVNSNQCIEEALAYGFNVVELG